MKERLQKFVIVSSIRIRSLLAGDPAAHSGNGEHRFVRAGFTGITSSLAKAVALLCTLAIAPITFRYLGAERFGLWMTITSLSLFVTFTDLGVGSGLTTTISEALGKRNSAELQRSVACAFWMLTAISCLLTSALFLIVPHVSWPALYGVGSAEAVREAGPATAALLVCTALNMPLGTVMRVQMGYQQAFITDMWTAAGSVLGLVGVLMSVHMGAGLPWLVLSLAGAGVIMTGINFIAEFGIRRPELRPTLRLFSVHNSVRLGRIGFLFLIQQVCGLVFYVSDNLVIARMLGPAEVGHFAMVQRLFSAGLVAGLFLCPLWPAFGEAISRGDLVWIRKALRRVQISSLAIGGTFGLGLLLISGPVLRHWMGQQTRSLGTVCIAFAVWVVLWSYITGMNSALNHPGMMVRHLWLFGVSAFVALFLKIYFVRHFGISGVVWATLIAYGVIYVIPVAVLAERSLKQASQKEDNGLLAQVAVSGVSGVE